MIAAISLILVAHAHAQSGSGAVTSGSVAAAVVDAGTSVSLAGSVGYRFNRVRGLGVEITSIPTLKFTLPTAVPSPYASVVYSNADGNALFFTTNVRVEIPTVSRRVLPFAVGGGGIASTIQRYTVTVRPLLPPVPVGSIGGPVGTVIVLPAPISPIVTRPESSSTGLALTLGGGVSVLATQHISIDIDLRSLYIRGNPNGSIGRFGVGASYRF
jgi:hypothetical protein